MSELPQLSVIVPCHDDAEPLARLLTQIPASAAVEVLVVSSAIQHDEVARVCSRNGAQFVGADAPRGARLLQGAGMASAPNLWFLHADAVLADGAVNAVIQAFTAGQIGGYFQFRLLGPRTLQKRWIEWTVDLRCKLGGIPYGDQAPFVTAAEYNRAEGHEPLPLFDEFRLMRRLMQTERFRALPVSVGVDARRWEKNGFFLHTLKNRFFSLAFTLGISPARLADWYYKR